MRNTHQDKPDDHPSPSVFISYTRETPRHNEQVVSLAQRLRGEGFAANIDRYEVVPEEGWVRWMERNLLSSDFIVVICTETYTRRALMKEAPGVGHGAIFEYAEIAQMIYNDQMRNRNIIPVGFGPHNEIPIPPVLQLTTYYDVSESSGFDELISRLRGKPDVVPAQLGEGSSAAPRGTFAESFSGDVTTLKKITERSLRRLLEHERMKIDDASVHVDRAIAEDVLGVAHAGPFLIIGEPGIGKSAVLGRLAHDLQQAGHDVVVLDAQQIKLADASDFRIRLGLRYEFDDVLASWRGEKTGFLLVDSLDAARTGDSSKAFRDMIERVLLAQTRWNVIACVRTYDLRHSPTLRSLFAASRQAHSTAPKYHDPTVGSVSHFRVPPLEIAEIGQVASQHSQLEKVWNSASLELKSLLRNPYNLSLAANLAESTSVHQTLRSVSTQQQLLDLYWIGRVTDEEAPGACESELRTIAERMLTSRSMQVSRLELPWSAALHTLLSREVLVEHQRTPTEVPNEYVLSFPHAIMFDYALARLLLRGTDSALCEMLANNRDAVLLIQPSIKANFQHLWESDQSRSRFWRSVLAVERDARIPQLAKMLGPSLAAEAFQSADDLQPLLAVDDDPATTKVIQHFVRALSDIKLGERLVGAKARPWSRALRDSALALNPHPHDLYIWLSLMTEDPNEATNDQNADLNLVARKLLEAAWAAPNRWGFYVRTGIISVARTYRFGHPESRQLLQRMLAREHLARFGYDEAHWLAAEIKHIWPCDPDFVVDIYDAIFGFEEKSDEKTSIAPSRIFGFSSNRRQDYHQALYLLGEKFGQFLRDEPRFATQALLRSVSHYARQHQRTPALSESRREFVFRGRKCRLVPDLSEIWDGGTVIHDDAIKMLDEFDEYMTARAEMEDFNWIDAALDTIAEANEAAIVWRRLIRLGARLPKVVGTRIPELAMAVDLLTEYDTTTQLESYLAATYQYLDDEKRSAIERAILSIPESAGSDSDTWIRRCRDNLLRSIPISLVARKDALAQIESLEDTAPSVVEPKIALPLVANEEISLLDELATNRGGAFGRPKTHLEVAIQAVDPFFMQFQNSVPPVESIEQVLPALRRLHLAAEETTGVDADFGWSIIAAVSRQISSSDWAKERGDVQNEIVGYLLESSSKAMPRTDPSLDESFNRSQSWGSPSARVDAAIGLLNLLSRSDDGITNAIISLGRDKSPIVRYIIASRLGMLRSQSDLMWTLAEGYADDGNRGVQNGLVSFSLRYLAHDDFKRALSLANKIYEANKSSAIGALEVRKACISILVYAALANNDAGSQKTLNALLHAPETDSDLAEHLVFDMVNFSNNASLDLEQRRKLWATITAALEVNLFRVRSLYADRGIPFDQLDESVKSILIAIIHFADEVAERLYFASGAFQTPNAANQPSPNPDFFSDASAAMKVLAEFPSAVTTQHLVKTLTAYIRCDPRAVFSLAVRAIKNGAEAGYALEYLGVEAVCEFIRAFIADYHELVETDLTRRSDLIQVLDYFVAAGWPQMQTIVAELEHLFR